MRPPESWQRARVTLAIALLTVVAWLLPTAVGAGDWAAVWGGFVPARLSSGEVFGAHVPVIVAPLTATLVHSGIIHLVFNLMILLFCGRATENILGPSALLALYVVGAYAAAAAHYFSGPTDVAPMIGSSGAISAILGAYAMLFGRNRVKIADPRLALLANALWLAVAWIALQLLIGITFQTSGARIAIAAHVGGFLSGLLLAKPLLIFRYRRA